MSIAPRAHQCSSRPRTWAGQSGLVQRQSAASSSTAPREIVDPHSGHCFGKWKNLFAARAFSEHDTDDGRNNFSGLFDRDRIADANVFALQFIFVVKRCAPDHRARELNGLQFRNGCQLARAPNLDRNGLQLRLGLFRFVLVSDGPAWRFGSGTDFFAQRKLVELHYRAVGLIPKFLAQLIEFLDGTDQVLLPSGITTCVLVF
jgi:hypothetical protein